jgi:biotin transport system substrate-specific component
VTIRITGLLAGTVIIYVCGVAWLMYSLTIGLLPAVLSGVLPFIPGDVIKIYAAYMIAKRLP